MYIVTELLENGSFKSEWITAIMNHLLGFVVYYLIVQKLLKSNVQNNSESTIMKDVINDIFKFGTMLITARILSGLSLDNNTWQIQVLYVLVGYSVYNLVVKKLIPVNNLKPQMKDISNNWLKQGTMMIVFRLLSEKSFNDPVWLTRSLYYLLGFTVYQIGTKPLFGITYSI